MRFGLTDDWYGQYSGAMGGFEQLSISLVAMDVGQATSCRLCPRCLTIGSNGTHIRQCIHSSRTALRFVQS